jgi:hypothetical protein
MLQDLHWLIGTLQPVDILVIALMGWFLDRRIRALEMMNAKILNRFDDIIDCHKMVHRGS